LQGRVRGIALARGAGSGEDRFDFRELLAKLRLDRHRASRGRNAAWLQMCVNSVSFS